MKKETFFLKMSAVTLMLLMTFCVIFSACSMDDDLYIKPKTLATRSTLANSEPTWSITAGKYEDDEYHRINENFNYNIHFNWTAGSISPFCTSEITITSGQVMRKITSVHNITLNNGDVLERVQIVEASYTDNGTSEAHWTTENLHPNNAKVHVKIPYQFWYVYVNNYQDTVYCESRGLNIEEYRPSSVQHVEQIYEGIWPAFYLSE